MDGILEKDYVSQKIFDIQIEDIKYRTNAERERVDDRIARNQAVIDKNMAEVKAMFAELRSEINNIRAEIHAEISDVRNDLKSDIKVLYTEIKATNDRFDDMKESQNKWFTVFGMLFTAAAIIAPVAVAVVQHFMAK